MSDDTKKLSIIVFSGELDKVHYAMAMAAAAAAIGTPATLFFTMEACRGLEKQGDDGVWPWQRMPVSTSAIRQGGEIDDGFKSRGIANFEELLESCIELKVRFMVCEMGLRALDMEADSLRDDVPITVGGLVTFFNDTSKDGSMVFI